ncbi:MAG: transglutaminase-like domain-containing protein [Spirochaetes bacterium]|jgi:hypothetical protein|nr:transglutaminase-like domain-containing protein [Spirochaetota bacterium]
MPKNIKKHPLKPVFIALLLFFAGAFAGEGSDFSSPASFRNPENLFLKNARTRVEPIGIGKILGMAVMEDHVFLLVGGFNGITDVIFKINQDTGRIKSIWGIGRVGARCIASDGRNLWVISESRKNFLRKFNLAGKAAAIIESRSSLSGRISGLAYSRGGLVFSVRSGGESKIYSCNLANKSFRILSSMKGSVRSIAGYSGNLAMFLDYPGQEPMRRLVIYDPERGIVKKMLFINSAAHCMASESGQLYALRRRKKGAMIYPLAVLEKENIIAADPLRRRVHVRIVLPGREARHGYEVFIPYPVNRDFQSVKNISLKPEPEGLFVDRHENKWAKIKSEKIMNNTVDLEFDLSTVSVAYTLDLKYMFDKKHVPEAVFTENTGETCSLDLSSFIVKSHSSRIKTCPEYIPSLMAIRDYVGTSIKDEELTTDEPKASTFLYKGTGGGYGQSLGFAAISRLFGYPVRAVCAYNYYDDRPAIYKGKTAVWNQFYMPGSGWTDLKITDGSGKKASTKIAGYRLNNVFISYSGGFDVQDFEDSFADGPYPVVCRKSGSGKAENVRDAQITVTSSGVR